MGMILKFWRKIVGVVGLLMLIWSLYVSYNQSLSNIKNDLIHASTSANSLEQGQLVLEKYIPNGSDIDAALLVLRETGFQVKYEGTLHGNKFLSGEWRKFFCFNCYDIQLSIQYSDRRIVKKSLFFVYRGL